MNSLNQFFYFINNFPFYFSRTAAHCVKLVPEKWNLESVRIGEHNTNTEIDCNPKNSSDCAPAAWDNLIVEKIVYNDYNKTSSNQHFDIALLRLETKITFHKYVQPICLPSATSLQLENYDDTSFEVTGWGNDFNINRNALRTQKIFPREDGNNWKKQREVES